MENIKDIFEIKDQYLNQIQAEEVKLKHELKKYKTLDYRGHRKMNQIYEWSVS